MKEDEFDIPLAVIIKCNWYAGKVSTPRTGYAPCQDVLIKKMEN
jgi:hypothetical protein